MEPERQCERDPLYGGNRPQRLWALGSAGFGDLDQVFDFGRAWCSDLVPGSDKTPGADFGGLFSCFDVGWWGWIRFAAGWLGKF